MCSRSTLWGLRIKPREKLSVNKEYFHIKWFWTMGRQGQLGMSPQVPKVGTWSSRRLSAALLSLLC